MKITVRNEFIIILILGLVLLGLIALDVQGVPGPLAMLRLLLGLAYVLFMPGYALQAALFPADDELDGPERLALSFGLSIAVVPPIALILDQLPWGLRLWPIVIAEALVITLFSAIALYRRSRLPVEQRTVLSVDVDPGGWWAAQDRTNRVLYTVLFSALLMAAVSAAAIVLLPKPGEAFTEFYILGPEGLAENYPREAVAGQPLSVTLGITNREGDAQRYRVDVHNGTHHIGALDTIQLDHEETYEAPITFAPVKLGDDVQIRFLLYREGDAGDQNAAEEEPYRSLRLWIRVTE
jgi:uncharacterized membrane protein